MANSKISALTSATTPLAGTEVLPIVQSSATVKVATNDLTVKNVRSNATTGILQVAGPSAGSTRTMTTPDANFTVARTDAANSFTGDQTLSTGNLVQGTAAKGINFTANTATTGSTSRLLNWYEEGDYVPTVTAAVGTITSYTLSTAKYTRVGRLVFVTVQLTITNAGTGVGALLITTPFTCAGAASGSITESAVVGYGGRTWMPNGTATMYCAFYDNTSPIVNNYVITASITYSV